MKLQFKKLHEAAQLPKRGSEHAVGYDVSTVEHFTLLPGTARMVPTGLSAAIPDEHYGRIAPRSGLAKKSGIGVLAGVVDPDYRGEIAVILVNHGQSQISFQIGDRIAQLILERCSTPEAEWVDELPETVRGVGGFGSSGR